MQEYCNRGTKRDATKAMLKLLANNLSLSKRRKERQNKRRAKQALSSKSSSNQLNGNQRQNKCSKVSFPQRYLPHNPQYEIGDTHSKNTNNGKEEMETFKKPENAPNKKVNVSFLGNSNSICC